MNTLEMKHQILHCTMNEFVQMQISHHRADCSPFSMSNECIDEVLGQGTAEQIHTPDTLTHIEVYGDGLSTPPTRFTPCDANCKVKSMNADQFSEAMAKAWDAESKP